MKHKYSIYLQTQLESRVHLKLFVCFFFCDVWYFFHVNTFGNMEAKKKLRICYKYGKGKKFQA